MAENEAFLPPRPVDKNLNRKKVLLILDDAKAKKSHWVYVGAPGGFGKTVSVSQWINAHRNKIAWITLETSCNDPDFFVRKFVKALSFAQRSNRKLGWAADGPAGTPKEILSLCTSLMLDNEKEYVIVLDDFHLIKNGCVVDLLADAMDLLPPSVTLCVLGRGEPPDGFSRFILGGDMTVVSEKDLAFDEDEVRALLLKNGMDGGRAGYLVGRTEGWPIAVRAFVTGSQGSPEEAVSRGQTDLLYRYLNSSVWNEFTPMERDFLIKTAPAPLLDEGVCALLSGREDSRSILEGLHRRNSFTIHLGDGIYRFNPMFREFLLNKLRDSFDEKTVRDLYRTLARGLLDRGDYYEAAAIYMGLDDLCGFSDCCKAFTRYNPEGSVEERLLFFKKNILYKFDFSGDEDLPVMAQCAFMYYLDGNAGEFSRLMDLMYSRERAIDDRSFQGFLALLKTLDFRIPIEGYADDFVENPDKLPSPLFSGTVESPGTFTANIPFFHRALRDRSDLALAGDDIETVIGARIEPFSRFMGESYPIIGQCLMAGIYYERDSLQRAYDHAVEGHGMVSAKGVRKDLFFSANMILAQILKAMGRAEEASIIGDEMGLWIDGEGLSALSPNFTAWKYRERIREGDLGAGEEWLKSARVDLMARPSLYGIYQHLTTERALIASGKAALAVLFGEKLLRLAKEFHRPMDFMEVSVLLSAAQWDMGNRRASLAHLDEALSKASIYGYRRVFVDEATLIGPAMGSLLKNARAEGRELSEFAADVSLAITEELDDSPVLPVGPVSLDERQRRILDLLKHNASYRDIAEDLDIAHSTAKYHVLKLYRSLGVTSGPDALKKARLLGMI